MEIERGTSWIGVLIGMLTALGAALLLCGIIGVIVTFIVALLALDPTGTGAGTGAGITSLAGILAMLFLSYLIGGYAAGRVTSRKGTRHDLLAALPSVAVTILLLLTGAVAGIGISDNLSGVVVPDVPADNEQQGLGPLLAFSVISGILILLVPFIGGIIGGGWGARTGRRRP